MEACIVYLSPYQAANTNVVQEISYGSYEVWVFSLQPLIKINILI